MNHTPGPWYVGDGSPESNFEGANCIIAVRGERRTTLVNVNNWFGDESLANARLIAAAPELLAFVKKTRDSVVCVCRVNKIAAQMGAGIPCTRCEADALIAKAEAAL